MPAILYVRAKSSIEDRDELERRLLERKPKFLDVPGLIQKVYGEDPETGEFCGIYFFESKEDLGRFAQSELAQTIGSAYEVTSIRKEVYNTLYSLRPENGPLTI
ncbi:MAG: hypothetical protein EP326_08635 [Deltaproteobacteria bacterium]|nr:MAG: hypothetical protein EP326_08635 [Deltaproteobacteria bacterium]TNF30081.1 MAG: hypothetical protein EP319_06160 [Deltaproteobacteria bacterium]